MPHRVWTAASTVLLGSVPLLLPRLREQLLHRGRFERSAVWALNAVYGGQALLVLTAPAPGVRSPSPDAGAARVVGGSLATAGVTLMAAGMGAFSGTEQVYGRETGPLVTSGVYRWSRNPQYVGWTAIVTGLAVARRSPLAAVPVLAGCAALGWWVRVEEQYLVEQFGEDYRDFRGSTPRWLGAPRH